MSRVVLVMASLLLMSGGWQLQRARAEAVVDDHVLQSLAARIQSVVPDVAATSTTTPGSEELPVIAAAVVGDSPPQSSAARPPHPLPDEAAAGTTIPWLEEFPVIASAEAAAEALAWWNRQEDTSITGFQQLHQQTLACGGTIAAVVDDAGLVVSFTIGGRLAGRCAFSDAGDLRSSHPGDERRVAAGTPPSAEQLHQLALACRRLSQVDENAVYMLQGESNTPFTTMIWRRRCGSWQFDAYTAGYEQWNTQGGSTLRLSIGSDGSLQECTPGGWTRTFHCPANGWELAPAAAELAPALPLANN